MRDSSISARALLTGLTLVLALGACQPLSLSILTLGAGAGISHQMSGPASKTFTAPLPKVKAATVQALRRMDIKVASRQKTGTGEILYARARNRDIEIEIEAITRTTTRVRAVARKDLLMVDAATAAEIISQTQKAMAAEPKPA